mmetsp:Transcript_67276/g.184509  ORF Transcript_67276/g.184509 Transcript_67276/m.184509 type:complete len:100 (-) Transcript_67276:122-421(-)
MCQHGPNMAMCHGCTQHAGSCQEQFAASPVCDVALRLSRSRDWHAADCLSSIFAGRVKLPSGRRSTTPGTLVTRSRLIPPSASELSRPPIRVEFGIARM